MAGELCFVIGDLHEVLLEQIYVNLRVRGIHELTLQ
jgi:hypothetical protein